MLSTCFVDDDKSWPTVVEDEPSAPILIATTLSFSVRQWSGRPGFNLRSSHIKDFKNGT